MMYLKSRRQLAKEDRIAGWRALSGKYFRAGVGLDALIDLERGLHGRVVTPQDPEYEDARQGFNPAFQSHPRYIAFCEAATDVAVCLRFAKTFGIDVVCRSGRHSFAGFSGNDGMVLDVSGLNSVTIDAPRNIATVGPGATFARLNAALDGYRLHVPGAGCESVCVGGYMQGGGYGMTSRELGMNCDNVVEATIMLANQDVLVTSPTSHPDLFFAIRGGTGNNFGVLLEIKYQLHSLWQVWAVRVHWPLEQAPRVIAELQRHFMVTGAPSTFGYECCITTYKKRPLLILMAMFHGTSADGRHLIEPLLGIGKPKTHVDEVGTYVAMNEKLFLVPFQVPPVDGPVSARVRSGYISQYLQETAWKQLARYIKQHPTTHPNCVGVEPYGGAIRYPNHANAFIHRDVHMNLWASTFWVDEAQRPHAEKWLDDVMIKTMGKYFVESYQNYPDRKMTGRHAQAYWGQQYPQLREVKRKYDPENFFRFMQSVEP